MSLWTWPVPGVSSISSKYNENRGTYNHKGIDINGPLGTPIVAASGGKVIASGTASGYGNWIKIDHGNGIVSIYGHMRTRLVEVGAEVKAGDPIALIGSEGESSGPHLHFQVEKNGVPQNPFNYIPSDGTVSKVDKNYEEKETQGPSSTDIPNTSSMTTVSSESGGSATIGQRVSDVTPQPIHAYVKIYYEEDGERLVLLSSEPPKPNIIQGFEYNRLQDAGETASITLFDDNWVEIESILINHWNKLIIEYGYYDTGKKSPQVIHMMSNYSIEFEFTGPILHVETITQGIYQNLNLQEIPMNTYNPTNAVKSICDAMNWTYDEKDFDASSNVASDNPFNLSMDFPITYIQETIIPQAAANGEIFYFYLDSDNRAYFKRMDNTDTLNENTRTYIYQKGYDSPVIDITFDVKGTFGGAESAGVATTLEYSAFNTKTKSPESHTITNVEAITAARVTGESINTAHNQSTPLLDAGGYTPSQMKSILYYKMRKSTSGSYEATMTIVGDPTIRLFEYVRIINVTDDGFLHRTSGVYWVIGITDSIHEGSMVTVLKLIRNASIDIDGIEIINPKYFIQ